MSAGCRLTAFWSVPHTDSWHHESERSLTWNLGAADSSFDEFAVQAPGLTGFYEAELHKKSKKTVGAAVHESSTLLFGTLLSKTVRFCPSGMSRTSLRGTVCKPASPCG